MTANGFYGDGNARAEATVQRDDPEE